MAEPAKAHCGICGWVRPVRRRKLKGLQWMTLGIGPQEYECPNCGRPFGDRKFIEKHNRDVETLERRFVSDAGPDADPDQANADEDFVAQLRALSELRESGALTEEEFGSAKARILNHTGESSE